MKNCTVDELSIKELKLAGKNVYVAEYERVIYVRTKPYEATDIDDAQREAWEAEIESEYGYGGSLRVIKNMSTGETEEFP